LKFLSFGVKIVAASVDGRVDPGDVVKLVAFYDRQAANKD
jgi:hypothetical protein